MSKSTLKDIVKIEVQFVQNGGKRESAVITLNEPMQRQDALQVASAISFANDSVAVVRCYTATGSYI